jgi:hypothetical protein
MASNEVGSVTVDFGYRCSGSKFPTALPTFWRLIPKLSMNSLFISLKILLIVCGPILKLLLLLPDTLNPILF